MQVVDDANHSVDDAANTVFDASETTSIEVVAIAKDVAASVSVMVEVPVEDAPPAPEPTTAQVVVGPSVISGGAEDTSDVVDAVKTSKAVFDATLAEVPASGEFARTTCSRAYVVFELILSGLGENTEDLPPVSPTELAQMCNRLLW